MSTVTHRIREYHGLRRQFGKNQKPSEKLSEVRIENVAIQKALLSSRIGIAIQKEDHQRED